MTPENLADCKAILATLTAEPMPGVTAKLVADESLHVTYNDMLFALRDGVWCGYGISMFVRLNSSSVARASTVHAEIARVAAVMSVAAGKPNPQHAAEFAKIAAALGHTGVMSGLNVVALARNVKRQANEAVECNQRLFEIHQALGAPLTAQQEDVIAAITAMRKTDPLGQLGAPTAYDNGQALTVKERLLYLLARIP